MEESSSNGTTNLFKILDMKELMNSANIGNIGKYCF